MTTQTGPLTHKIPPEVAHTLRLTVRELLEQGWIASPVKRLELQVVLAKAEGRPVPRQTCVCRDHIDHEVCVAECPCLACTPTARQACQCGCPMDCETCPYPQDNGEGRFNTQCECRDTGECWCPVKIPVCGKCNREFYKAYGELGNNYWKCPGCGVKLPIMSTI